MLIALGSAVITVHGAQAHRVNIDAQVYKQTLNKMRSGEGYYQSMRDSLQVVLHTTPSKSRAVRPPTLFLFLSRFPPGAWRPLSGLAVFATLVSSYLLASKASTLRGALAVIFVGHFMWLCEPGLYLHGEFWGLPFALAGIVAMRAERWRLAIALFLVAACVRELYVALLIAPLIMPAARRYAVGALVVAAALYGLNFAFVQDVLSANGTQPPLSGLRDFPDVFFAFTLSDSGVWSYLGLVLALAGLITLGLKAKGDNTTRVVAAYVFALSVVTIIFGRAYWGLCFAPIILTYAALYASEPKPTHSET